MPFTIVYVKWISSSVQAKFTLAISFTVILFFSILLLISFTTFKNYSIEKSKEYASTILYETDSKINLFFNDVEDLARSLSGYRAVYQVDEKDMRNIFISAVGARKEYIRAIYLGTKEGKMYEWGFGEGFVNNTPSFPPGYDPRKRPWYITGEKKRIFTVSKPYIYASINALGITCVTPVYGNSGEFIGVLGIDIILQGLNKIINDLNVQRNSRIILLNRSHEILASQFDSISGNVTTLKKFIPWKNITGTEGSFIEVLNGKKMFVSYSRNDATGWILLIALPFHDIMEFSNNTIEVIFFTDILLIFILVIVIIILTRKIVTGHLSNLVSVMKRISSGDLGARFPVSGTDEFAEMGTLFNQLAELREKYTYRMEEEVRKRTEAISRLQQENIRLRVLEEKERIFRNLHDSLGARLTNIFISNNVALSVLPEDNEVLSNMLSRIEKNAELAISDLKEIIFDHGEKRAIIDLTGFFMINIKSRLELKNINLKYRIKHRDIINSIPGGLRMEIEKIFQELVTNVLRHSGASLVTIDLRATESRIILSFKDDGIGYDKERELSVGYGLSGILDRIKKMDGSIKIKTAPKAGAKYIITLPIRTHKDD